MRPAMTQLIGRSNIRSPGQPILFKSASEPTLSLAMSRSIWGFSSNQPAEAKKDTTEPIHDGNTTMDAAGSINHFTSADTETLEPIDAKETAVNAKSLELESTPSTEESLKYRLPSPIPTQVHFLPHHVSDESPELRSRLLDIAMECKAGQCYSVLVGDEKFYVVRPETADSVKMISRALVGRVLDRAYPINMIMDRDTCSLLSNMSRYSRAETNALLSIPDDEYPTRLLKFEEEFYDYWQSSKKGLIESIHIDQYRQGSSKMYQLMIETCKAELESLKMSISQSDSVTDPEEARKIAFLEIGNYNVVHKLDDLTRLEKYRKHGHTVSRQEEMNSWMRPLRSLEKTIKWEGDLYWELPLKDRYRAVQSSIAQTYAASIENGSAVLDDAVDDDDIPLRIKRGKTVVRKALLSAQEQPNIEGDNLEATASDVEMDAQEAELEADLELDSEGEDANPAALKQLHVDDVPHPPQEMELQFNNILSKMGGKDGKVWWSHELYKNKKGRSPTVHYASTTEDMETLAERFVGSPVLGFDMEWAGETPLKRAISLIQVANGTDIGLFHTARREYENITDFIPPTLKMLIQDPEVILTGSAVRGDAQRLARYVSIKPAGVVELSHLHHRISKSPSTKSAISLARLTEVHLQFPLAKGKVRTSDWSAMLTPLQMTYAAADAYASYRVFDEINRKRKQLTPIPAFPEIWSCSSESVRAQAAKNKAAKAAAQAQAIADIEAGVPTKVIRPKDWTNPELEEAFNWIDEYVKIRDAPPAESSTSTSTRTKVRTTTAQLRCYHIWHHQKKSVQEVASLSREKPLLVSTVVTNIMEALRIDVLPFEKNRLDELASYLPVEVAMGRYRALIKAYDD